MDEHPGHRADELRPPRLLLTAVLLVVTACAGEAPPIEQPDAVAEVAVGEEQAADPAAAATLRRFLPDQLRGSVRAETFPHDAHFEIDCAACHEVAQGHGSHESVQCTDCHRSSAATPVGSLTTEECQSCHHDVSRALDCAECHETPGRSVSAQELFLEVWSSPRPRDLAFDHVTHQATSCAACHREAPVLTPDSCVSCHADHHTAAVRCAECHLTPPESAHDLESHLTCSGAGCHRNATVEVIAQTRTVCLSCHQDLEDHEPEGECIECHQVRGGGAAGAGQ